jgi:DNA replication protein DnaC
MSLKPTLSVLEAGARLGEMVLVNQLHELHLTSFLEQYEALAQDASRASWPYPKYLATLTQKEIDRRTSSRNKERIKQAHFPLLKELADFDFSAVPKLNKQQVLHLAQGRYLHDAASLLLVGAPGLGKTHIATALGLAACRQGQRVRFYTVANLINHLHQAQNEQRLSKFIDQALRHQLLILDEFGYLPFSTTGAHLLFQFCSALHERVSLIITTNLPFADWVQVLGDARLTAGLLDRLTYKSHILEFVGDSYRFRQRLAAINNPYPPVAEASFSEEEGAAAPSSSENL